MRLVAVTDFDQNRVEIFDLEAGRQIASVEVPGGPVSAVFSLNGTHLFVVSLLAGQLSEIEVSSASVTRTTEVGDSPRGLAISPSGLRLFVSNVFSNELMAVDTRSLQVTERIPVSRHPRGVAVTPDGSQVLVTARGPDRLVLIDMAGWTESASVPLSGRPDAVGVEPGGEYAVVSVGNRSTLEIVDLASLQVVQRFSSTPEGLKAEIEVDPAQVMPPIWSDRPGAALVDLETRIGTSSAPLVMLVDPDRRRPTYYARVLRGTEEIEPIPLTPFEGDIPAAPASVAPAAPTPTAPRPAVPEAGVSGFVEPYAPESPIVFREFPDLELEMIGKTPEEAAAVARRGFVFPEEAAEGEAEPTGPLLALLDGVLQPIPEVQEDRVLRIRGASDLEITNPETGEFETDDWLEIIYGPLEMEGVGAAVSQEALRASFDSEVELHTPELSVYASSLEYDMEQDVGHLLDVEAIYRMKQAEGDPELPIYFRTPRLDRLGPNRAQAANATFTTCNLPHPHYHLRTPLAEFGGEEGQLTKVSGRGVWLHVGRVPIFYLPRISQEVGERRRQMTLDIGRESDIGAFLRTGYGLELHENLDTLLRVDAYEDEGVGLGLDGTYRLGQSGEGKYILYGTSQSEGRVQAYHRQLLPRDWIALLQVEQWSDDDFLKDFYYDEFKKRTEPATWVNFTQTRPAYILSLTGRKHTNKSFTETERLPEGNFNIMERRLGNTNLFLTASNSVGYLEVAPNTPFIDDATRNDTTLRLSYDQRLGPWLNFVPFAEFQGTYYSRDRFDDSGTYRAQVNAGVTAQSRFRRDFGFRIGQFERVRHIVIPSVTFESRNSTSLEASEAIPFDGIDDRPGRTRVEFKLDNTFDGYFTDGRRLPFVKLNLYGGIDLSNEGEEARDWEGIFAIFPRTDLRIAVQGEIHEAEEEFERYMAGIFWEETGGRLRKAAAGFALQEAQDDIINREVFYEFALNLGDKWRIGFEHRYDFEDNDLEYQSYEVIRDLHCWEAGFRFRERNESTDFRLVLTLKSIPGLRFRF